VFVDFYFTSNWDGKDWELLRKWEEVFLKPGCKWEYEINGM